MLIRSYCSQLSVAEWIHSVRFWCTAVLLFSSNKFQCLKLCPLFICFLISIPILNAIPFVMRRRLLCFSFHVSGWNVRDKMSYEWGSSVPFWREEWTSEIFITTLCLWMAMKWNGMAMTFTLKAWKWTLIRK